MCKLIIIMCLLSAPAAYGKALTKRQAIETRILRIMETDPDSFDMNNARERGLMPYACDDGFYTLTLTDLCNLLIETANKGHNQGDVK